METNRVDAQAGSVVTAPDLYRQPDPSIPTAPGNELGKDEFLQLLVAQLKYQDPLEPTSSEEFISTTAQFTVVEKLDELTKQGESTALVQSLTTASALVGREITANLDGALVDAVVDHSRIVGGEVVLDSSAGEIRLNQIVSVGAVPPSQLGLAPSTPDTTTTEATNPAEPVAAAEGTTSVDEAAVADEPPAAVDDAAPDAETAAQDAATPVDDIAATEASETTTDGSEAETTTDSAQAVPESGNPGGSTDENSEPAQDQTPVVPTEPVAVTPEPAADPVIDLVEPPAADGPIAATPADPVITTPVEPTVPAAEAEPIPVTDPVPAAPVEPTVPAAPTEPTVPVTDPVPAAEAEPIPITDPVPIAEAEPTVPAEEPVPEPLLPNTDTPDPVATDPGAPGDPDATAPVAVEQPTVAVPADPTSDPAVASAIQALSNPAIAQAIELLADPAIADAVRVLSDPTIRAALDAAGNGDAASAAQLAANPLLLTMTGQETTPAAVNEAPRQTSPEADTETPTGSAEPEVTDPFDPFDPLG